MATKKIAVMIERLEERLSHLATGTGGINTQLSNIQSRLGGLEHRERFVGSSAGRDSYIITVPGPGLTRQRDNTSTKHRNTSGMNQNAAQGNLQGFGHSLLQRAGQLHKDLLTSGAGGNQFPAGQTDGRLIPSGHRGGNYHGGLTQMDGKESYVQYLDTLSDPLLDSCIRDLLSRYMNAKEKDLNKWLDCWKDIALDLFPAKYGFRVTTESLTLLPGDSLFRLVFSWPVNYLAIRKGAKCQEFGIICAHDPTLHVGEAERFKEAVAVTRELGEILQHVGRAGKRTYWIHTFGDEFVCVSNHNLLPPRKLQTRSESVLNPGSIDILRKVAQRIASRKNEKLFQSVPTEKSNEFISVPLN